MNFQKSVPILIGLLVFIIFVTFVFFTGSTIENFIDQEETPKEAELRKKLLSITSRLCPIQEEILINSAQSIESDPDNETNIQTSALEKCVKSDILACVKSEQLKSQKKPSKKSLEEAMIKFTKEADGPLFICPQPDNIYKLSPFTTKQLALSGTFFTLKIMEINKLMTSALRAEPIEPPPEDPWAGLDKFERQKKQQNFVRSMEVYKKYDATPPDMNDAEKESFLNARINELNSLLEQKDSEGVSIVEKTLSALESQFKILKKTQKDAKEGTLMPEIPDSVKL